MTEAVTILAVALSLLIAAGLILSRNILLRALGLAFRPIALPFRFIGRMLRMGRSGDGTHMGPTAFAATARHFRHQTDTERALGDDFEHERGFISTHGLIFKWMGVRVGFMRMPEELTDELAQEYAKLAQGFLGAPVPINADPRSLFEDVEGAVIAEQFHESDRGVIYLLNASRKMINANVRRLSVWFSAILSTVLVLNLLYNDGQLLNVHAMLAGAPPIEPATFNSLAFGLATCVGGAVFMWVLYFTEYAPYQRNNTREMANFLTRYMARINDHYRTTVGKAKSVTVGEERDSKRLSEAASLYASNITWLALRVFFIEAYVRNVVYQITRNSSYYLLFVPTVFILVLTVVLSALSALGGDYVIDPIRRIVELGWVFALLFVTVAVIYVLFLTNSMRCLDEIDQGEWISFHTLRLNATLSEVISKYAEDVGYWKNRVGASGI